MGKLLKHITAFEAIAIIIVSISSASAVTAEIDWIYDSNTNNLHRFNY